MNMIRYFREEIEEITSESLRGILMRWPEIRSDSNPIPFLHLSKHAIVFKCTSLASLLEKCIERHHFWLNDDNVSRFQIILHAIIGSRHRNENYRGYTW